MKFIAWNTEAVLRVKESSIQNVRLYNDSFSAPPLAPYVVVKPIEHDGGFKKLRFYAHFLTGNQDDLEGYLLKELPALFEKPLSALTRTEEGHEEMIYTSVIDTGIYMLDLAVSDDGSISGYRDFLLPIT